MPCSLIKYNTWVILKTQMSSFITLVSYDSCYHSMTCATCNCCTWKTHLWKIMSSLPSASTLISTYQNDKTKIGAPVSSAVDRQFAPIVAGIKQDVLINLLSCPRGDLHGQFPALGWLGASSGNYGYFLAHHKKRLGTQRDRFQRWPEVTFICWWWRHVNWEKRHSRQDDG